MHYTQYSHGKLANFHFGVTAGSKLNEMPQSSGVGRHKNLRFRRIRQHATGRLAGQLAPQRFVRLILVSLLQPIYEPNVCAVTLLDNRKRSPAAKVSD